MAEDKKNEGLNVQSTVDVSDPEKEGAGAFDMTYSRLYDRTCGFIITLFFSMVFVEMILEEVVRAYLFIKAGSQEMNVGNLLGEYANDPWSAAFVLVILAFIVSGALIHYSIRSGFVLGKCLFVLCVLRSLPKLFEEAGNLISRFPFVISSGEPKVSSAYTFEALSFAFYVLLIFAFSYMFINGKKEEILRSVVFAAALLSLAWLKAAFGHFYSETHGTYVDPIYHYTLLPYLPSVLFGWNAIKEYREVMKKRKAPENF